MAYRITRVCGILSNSAKTYLSPYCGQLNRGSNSVTRLLKPQVPLVSNVRHGVGFFNKLPADSLWKGVTSVSNAGMRRGRKKSLARRKNLNRGQVIGRGNISMVLPGLNAPLFQGKTLLKHEKLGPDPKREEELAKLRSATTGPKRTRLSPLDRGWSGGKPGGRKLGPPDPIGEDKFEGFETWILESKVVSTMTGNMGRKRKHSTFVVTGNGNGLAGFGFVSAPDFKTSAKNAKNRAGCKLMYIERYKEHTVLHDLYCQFGRTKIFVKKMPEGTGLVCHRALRECCKAIGIKDIYAKCEGALNVQHVTKAFFLGLLQQKTHQQLAEEKQLHVVEIKDERCGYPEVVASPSTTRKPHEIKSNEVLDFTQYVMGDRVVLDKKKPIPFFMKLKSYDRYIIRQERIRGHNDLRLRLCAEYGEVRSFLTDQYPEAKPHRWQKKIKTIEEEEAA